MRHRIRVTAAVAGVALSALLLTACGNDDDSASAEETTTAEVTDTTAAEMTETTAVTEETTADTDTTAAATGETPAGAPTGGDVSCPEGTKIAYFGPITGPNGNLGVNIKRGAELAVAEFVKVYPNCQVQLAEFDSQGDPDQAFNLAPRVINDDSVVAVIGPAFSGETDKTGSLWNEAGLPTISPSATRVSLSENGWTTFHRGLGHDGQQGPALARYIQNTLQAERVGVLDDQSDYGKGLSDIVASELGSAVAARDAFNDKATDFSAAIAKMKDADVDAIFFGGYYAQAGPLAKQIKAAGVTAQLVFADGVLDQGFIDGAGPDAEGAVITCPCAPAEGNPSFLELYQAQFNDTPKTYGAEAYDAANVFLNALADGNTDRASILEYVKSYDKPGVTKQMKWDETGEVAGTAIYAYKVEGGKLVGSGLIE